MPGDGQAVVAKGVIAVGRLAMEFWPSVRHPLASSPLARLGFGLVLGLGQGVTGLYAIGQAAIGLMLGLGQIATGEIAIGQLAYGKYVLAQIGYGIMCGV